MKLTDTQTNTLQLIHGNGHLTAQDIPLRGGARKKVLESLINRGLLRAKPCKNWINYSLTPEGRQAIGVEQPEADKKKPVTRPGTKLHTLVELLSRTEGATIAEIMHATGWQQHTVRGTLAGTLKKRLGLNISSDKPEGKDRIYRIVED
ncbi:hypothetical protein GCM10023116_05330 [Kistimonas scapharcae]|uniref:DUF3489 domain-containing protein n=1 Tax=Kistimonas scapharcae TaxID=1036133 RepID=A0ABP8UWI0_9GAMM